MVYAFTTVLWALLLLCMSSNSAVIWADVTSGILKSPSAG